jgi:hypothetical protein
MALKKNVGREWGGGAHGLALELELEVISNCKSPVPKNLNTESELCLHGNNGK